MDSKKLDENLPANLVADLVPLGHDVDTVPLVRA